MLLFGVALSWFMALIGLGTGFALLALVVFVSNTFGPPSTMPGWLQPHANHQPVSATVTAIRALALGGATTGKVVTALLWTIAITVVFAALAVRRYRRAA